MHGKIIFPNVIDLKENRFNNDTFDRTVWFVEDYLSGNVLDFCSRYLQMPTFEEMYNLVIKYFRTIKNPSDVLIPYNPKTGRMYMCEDIINTKPLEMCHLVDTRLKRVMCTIFERMPEYDYFSS